MQHDFGTLTTSIGQWQLQERYSNIQDGGLVLQGTQPECLFSSLSNALQLCWCSTINLSGGGGGHLPLPPGGAAPMQLMCSLLSEANFALWFVVLQH